MPQNKRYFTNCNNRKDEVLFIRIRVGHTKLTHSHIMEGNFRWILIIKHIYI